MYVCLQCWQSLWACDQDRILGGKWAVRVESKAQLPTQPNRKSDCSGAKGKHLALDGKRKAEADKIFVNTVGICPRVTSKLSPFQPGVWFYSKRPGDAPKKAHEMYCNKLSSQWLISLYSPSCPWLRRPKFWVSQTITGTMPAARFSCSTLPTMTDSVPILRNSTSILCLRICSVPLISCHYIPCAWPCMANGESKEERKDRRGGGKRGEKKEEMKQMNSLTLSYQSKQLARNVVRI